MWVIVQASATLVRILDLADLARRSARAKVADAKHHRKCDRILYGLRRENAGLFGLC
jgi:hypothetical protein